MSLFCRGEMRSKGFALRRLASNLGITIGPVVGGYLILIDYRWLFWADGVTSMAAAIVILLALKPESAATVAQEDRLPDRAAAPRSPWRDPTYILFLGLFLILVTVFAQLFSTFSLYLNSVYGLKENRIGPLWAVNTLMIVLFEMVLLHKLRKRSEMKLVALGALFIGAGFSLLPLGRGFLYAAFTVAVWTIGEMLIMPLTATVTANRAGASAGRYLGLLSLTFSLSMFIAPILGNWLFGTIGGDALWPTVGSACLFVAAGFWALRKRMAAG
jgi:MFS family permease